MKTTQTFSILFWANKGKSTSEGLPLFARITIDGKRAEISLKRKVDPNLWNPKASCVDGKSEVNNYIAQVKAELLKIYNQMQVLEENITAETIKARFTGKTEEKKTLLQIVDYHNRQMERTIGIDVVQRTYAKYQSLRNKLAIFIKSE
jgi:hypothetical protein